MPKWGTFIQTFNALTEKKFSETFSWSTFLYMHRPNFSPTVLVVSRVRWSNRSISYLFSKQVHLLYLNKNCLLPWPRHAIRKRDESRNTDVNVHSCELKNNFLSNCITNIDKGFIKTNYISRKLFITRYAILFKS